MMMKITKRDQKKVFYVVQFIESPFEGIDKYVCVPNSWLLLRTSSNGKAVVTYPRNGDSCDTRDRVKRKEKPNDEWRFYMACIKYASDNYENAEYWIASRNDNDPGEKKSEIRGTQPKPDLNKKLRSAGQSFSSGSNSDKSQLKAKPNENARKPMPRISIKRPLSQHHDENPNNKRLKLNENTNPDANTDHTIIAAGCSKKEHSIIITDNEFTQIDQTKTSSALNGKMNTEQSTQPGIIKTKQSVKMSLQSTSTKLTPEQHPSSKLPAQKQLSPQPPIEQQLPPQPTTDQKPSPHSIIDRQPLTNLIDEQHPSSKLSVEQQPSPIEEDNQQPLNLSISGIKFDESGEDIESCQNDLPEPVTVERLSTKTPLNILKQVPQPEPDNEKSTQLVRHEHSLPEQHPPDASAEQTKKFNDSQKIHLHWISTAPRMELEPPSTVNLSSQHLEHFQLPIFPASCTPNSEFRSAEFVGKKSIKVAGDNQTPCSRDCRDSAPSTSYHGANWGILCEPVAKQQSAAVKKLKNPVDKNTLLKGNSKNITTMQYPLSSMTHFSLSGNPAVTQTAPPTQNHFRQAQVNDIRCSREEKCINQKVPDFQGIVNTSAEQNFSKLAHQYRPFVGESREQQYVPTQADYLQQLACLQDMLKRHTVASAIDRRIYHENAIMNGGFVVPNPISKPVQFLPQSENQYIPVNSAYAQEVIRHDLMRGPTDGAHSTYKPNVQNGVKIQLVDRYSSSHSPRSSEYQHQKQYPPMYRDPSTASTQNDLTNMNPNSIEYSNKILAAVPKNLMAEPALSTKDAEVHTMTSSEIPHETQVTLIQLPRINKTMVDQATETDLTMEVNHCIDKIAGSFIGERASKLVKSACQTGEWLKEQSIIITDNEFTQIDQTKTSSALNGKMNTEQSTQPGVIKKNQSVKMSLQSTSTKLTPEQHPSSKLSAQKQLSPQPPIEQQLPPQPTTDQKPSPHSIIDRQPLTNLIDEQHPSSKLSVEQQPSPIEEDNQQPLSISVIEFDETDEDIESCQNDLPEPVTVERLSTKTPLNILKQVPQPEPDNEKSTQLVRHEHSLPEQHPPDASAEQTKKFNDSKKTHLHWILTAPRMELRPPSTVNQSSQHLEHFQLPIIPACSTLNSELQSAEFVGKKSIKVAGDNQTPCSRDCRDSAPSTSYHGANRGILCEPVAKQQSAAVKKLKTPGDKKTLLKGNSKNISTMQYPLSSMIHFSLSGNPAVTQTATPTQNHFRQAQVNDIRCSREEKCINQKVPDFQGIVNTSAEQNFSKLAHQYRPFVGESREQQYVPTQADYLQQFACLQDMLKRHTVASAIDRRIYHENAIMNGGFVVPNPISKPVQFLPQSENQYIPVNSAYAQEVIRHDLMRGPTDGAHSTYKPNVQNGVKIQLVDRYSSSHSPRSSEYQHQKQYPPMYRDPSTASTQNDLTNMNPNSIEYSNKILAAVPKNLMAEPALSTKDAEVHTMTSSEIPHETQVTLIQLPRINKTMVDQATETDLTMEVNHCIDKIAGSSVGERASKLVNSACQTGEWLKEGQGPTHQETASDSETVAQQEIESDNKLDSETHEENPTNVRYVTPEDQQVQSRVFAEQDMLNAIGTLVTRVGTNLSVIREIFNFLRNSTLECIQEYDTLLKKVDKFNSTEILQIPISPPNNVTSQVVQVTQERPAGDNDSNTGVGDAVTPIHEQKGKFSLPAEYDPNVTKWTLKYRENKSGLVELIPRTGVYVCRKEMKRCIRQSNDCRTLARLPLTEIFSQNALSLCSLTGGKPKAFNS